MEHRKAKTAMDSMARTSLRSIIVLLIAIVSLATEVRAFEMHISGRRQANSNRPNNPLDFYDSSIRSTKSVKFSDNGNEVFVNALEGK